jgi:hypothetical protein
MIGMNCRSCYNSIMKTVFSVSTFCDVVVAVVVFSMIMSMVAVNMEKGGRRRKEATTRSDSMRLCELTDCDCQVGEGRHGLT